MYVLVSNYLQYFICYFYLYCYSFNSVCGKWNSKYIFIYLSIKYLIYSNKFLRMDEIILRSTDKPILSIILEIIHKHFCSKSECMFVLLSGGRGRVVAELPGGAGHGGVQPRVALLQRDLLLQLHQPRRLHVEPGGQPRHLQQAQDHLARLVM